MTKESMNQDIFGRTKTMMALKGPCADIVMLCETISLEVRIFVTVGFRKIAFIENSGAKIGVIESTDRCITNKIGTRYV